MVSTAVEIDPRLITFVFPSIPESVPMARFHVRAALGFHELGTYADDAEIITSELVANAIQHVPSDGTETVTVTIARTRDRETVTVVVSDSSPEGPVMHKTPADSERGRGLQIVAALSAHWRWGGRVKPGRRRRVDSIPEGQSAIVGANIRTLRQRKEWSQAKLGEQMGWQSASTVGGAEGHRDGRQRFHRHGNRAASRHLRYLPPAAHDAVRELQRPAAGRVRLPGMRSRARRSCLGGHR